jgi:FkbM family methyltransferase
MIQLSPRGTHLAFEPIPAMAESLRREFPGARVYDLALSDVSGEATFRHVLNRPAYSGLKERSYPQAEVQIEVIPVRTVRLDELIPPDWPVRLIKVDVEGAELQVFRGAERTLRDHRPFVVFEHTRGAAEYYGTRPEMVYDLLARSCGLRISLLRSWLSGGAALSGGEFAEEFETTRNFYFLGHP